MEIIKLANVGLRFALELCMLAALGYSGIHLAKSLLGKAALGAGLPIAAAVIWGTLIAPKALYHMDGMMRFVLELLLFGTAAAGLYVSGRPLWAVGLLSVYVVNTVLLLVWNQ